MDCELRRRVHHSVCGLSGRDFLGATLRLGTAATLGAVKPANLLCLTRTCRDLHSLWNDHGPDLCEELGLAHRVLRQHQGATTVLFYRPGPLAAHLDSPAIAAILRNAGHRGKDCPALLDTLVTRSAPAIPDVVGCFLGYPAHDVTGFLRHRGKDAMLYGYWAVYDDVPGARSLFARIDHARTTIATTLLAA